MNKNHHLVQYKIFEGFENIIAFTTTKQTLTERNSIFTGDSSETLKNNRKQLAEKLNINASQLLFPRQTHTSCVAEITDIPNTEIKETDALVTNQLGICLCVQTADCVPILLFDPVGKVIAAVHAGWRGTINKIIEVVIQKMVLKYNSSPPNILTAIGPSISNEIYEVGDEVIRAARKTIPNAEITLNISNSGKFHFNLWEANRQILLENGVLSENIEILGECSFQNNEKYFSARKEGIDTGRMVSGIMLLK
ncbi:MAG: peptidoglycan editing factor PgeF, partial [Draconibacterium sp.]|nr:peptidoglycan editing factor PgeF [Draconibacterium sp.]